MNRRSSVLFVYLLFAAIVTLYGVLAAYFTIAYLWATYEDLVGEWAQFWFFATAFLFALRLARVRSPYRWYFALLAVSLFYVSGEEISWGQRIFSFATPTLLQEHNLQHEANLHNLFTGPIATPLKQAIEYLMAAGMVLYGAIYPFAVRLRFPPAAWLDRLGVAPPHPHLWPFFVTAAVLELGPLHFNEAELAEVLISCALALMAITYWHDHRGHAATETEGGAGRSSVGLTARLAGAVAVVALLAAASTYGSYATPQGRARIDNRISNGFEKFAGRYERYQRWETAADLYGRVHDQEPDRCSILRKLANCYSHLGDKEVARKYLVQAITLDLKRIAKKRERGRESVSANLSLARSYRQLGNAKSSEIHLRRALRIAEGRVAGKPKSGSAAYWLGKCYELQGDRAAAMREYRRAMELRPTRVDYQKAYYRLAVDS